MKLRHERTTNTGLRNLCGLKYSCVLASGEIVIYGSKTAIPGDCWFYLCDRQGNPLRTIHAPCTQRLLNLLPVTIDRKEYICVDCRNIRLINLETSDLSVAYTDIEVNCMCLGKSNTLYSVDNQGEISVFDTKGTGFTLKRTLPTIGMEATEMCYIRGSDMIILSLWETNRFCAMRSSDGQIVWDKSVEEIGGKVFDPMGLVYLCAMDSLIVGDRDNKQVIVVSGESGDVAQTVEIDGVHNDIKDLHVRDEELIVTNCGIHDDVKLYFYSVSLVYIRSHNRYYLIVSVIFWVS